MVEIDKLVKQYGDFSIDISLEIPDGVITGVIGKNGAGKSTMIKSILGLLKPTSGSVKVFGKDVESLTQSDKCDIGVALAESGFSMYLSAKDIAGILGKMYPRFKEEFFFDKCKQLGLPTGKQIKDYSTGMKAKLRVLVAISHEARLLILDEPTTGLDPQTRKMIWAVITKLRKENNMTVLLTTHYMEEASEADYVVIIDQGKMVAHGTPLDLKNKYVGDYMLIYNVKEEDVKKLGLPYINIPNGYKIEVNDTLEATNLIVNNRELFVDYELIKGKMDDVFLKVTGKNLEVK